MVEEMRQRSQATTLNSVFGALKRNVGATSDDGGYDPDNGSEDEGSVESAFI